MCVLVAQPAVFQRGVPHVCGVADSQRDSLLTVLRSLHKSSLSPSLMLMGCISQERGRVI